MTVSHVFGYMQGLTIKAELGKKNLIVGPNASGKTALMRTLRLGILGLLPELGKKNEALWKLSTNGSLSAGVELTNGDEYRRSWAKGKSGIEQVQKEIPVNPLTDIPLLSPSEYFALSAAERTQYIFTRVPMPEGYDQQRIMAEIAKVTEESEDVTTDDEDAVQKAQDIAEQVILAHDTLTAALTFLTDDKKGPLKEEQTRQNKIATDTKGALAEVTKLRASQHKTTDENLKGLEAQAQSLQNKRAEIANELGKLEGRRVQIEKHAHRIEEIKRMLAIPPTDYDTQIAESEKQMGELKAQKKEGKSKEECEQLYAQWQEAGIALAKAENRRDELNKRKAEIKQQLEQLAHTKECEHCGAIRSDWMKDPEPKLREEMELIEGMLAGEQKAIQLNTEQNDELHRQIREQQEIATHNAELALKFEQLKRKRQIFMESRDSEQKDHKRFEEELARLTGAEQGQAPSEDRIKELQQEQNDLKVQIDRLREQIRLSTELHANLKIHEEALARHNRASAFVKVLQAARKNLVKLQAEIVDKVFGGITERANAILGDLLPTPLVFQDGEVGRMSGTQFVSIDTFSGMEEALGFVSIAAALSANAPLRILLLDELGTLTPSMQAEVIRRLGAAVDRGDLDQVLLAIPREKAVTAPAGWNVIETAPLK